MTGIKATETWRGKQSFNGKCVNCPNEAAPNRTLCAGCLEKAKERKRKGVEKKRLERIRKHLGIEE